MSGRAQLVQAVGEHSRRQAKRSKPVVRATVTRVKPLSVVPFDMTITLVEDDDFDLTAFMTGFQANTGFAVGDLVLMSHDESWLLFDVVSSKKASLGPSGSAGGDLGGKYPNPQVVKIGGRAVSAVVFTDDSRLTDSRTPTGNAGGALTGTYPNPTLVKPTFTTFTSAGIYGTGYSDYGAGWQTPGYAKDQLNWVSLRGLAQKSAAYAVGDVIVTLPVGYRIGATEMYMRPAMDATNGTFIALITVAINGQVTLSGSASWLPTYSTPGVLAWVSLSEIRFQQAN